MFRAPLTTQDRASSESHVTVKQEHTCWCLTLQAFPSVAFLPSSFISMTERFNEELSFLSLSLLPRSSFLLPLGFLFPFYLRQSLLCLVPLSTQKWQQSRKRK